MSEDIDLKIVSDAPPTRSSLRRLREGITEVLLAAGFAFDPANPHHRTSKYENNYTIYRLPYEPTMPGVGALRPEIQIETSAWPLRLPPIELPVTSFIAEGYRRPPELAAMTCVALVETAAEKFVGLTRRAGSELAGLREKRDPTLVRHIYDLHEIHTHIDLAAFGPLAREVMLADVEAYGDRFPAYRDNPVAETLRAVEANRRRSRLCCRLRQLQTRHGLWRLRGLQGFTRNSTEPRQACRLAGWDT